MVAMRRLGFWIGLLSITTFAGGVLAASPAAARATTETRHVSNVSESDSDVNPCSGAPGTFTVTISGVFHSTVLPNGTTWETSALHGTVSFTPDDSTEPSYTGKLTQATRNDLQNQVEHLTFRLNLQGTDKSMLTLHETAHTGISASGPSFSFDKPRLTCR